MAKKSPAKAEPKAAKHQISNYSVIQADEDHGSLELRAEKEGIKKGDTVTLHRADGSQKDGEYSVKKIKYTDETANFTATFEKN